MRRLVAAPIRAYQRWVSPLIGPRCRFAPTCSQYAIEAVLTHGAMKGLVLVAWRIGRCHPLCEGGFDPVPPPGRWRSAG
jgi:putative membrane protein insertion efficiency factor